jgi:hypothetical protein
VDDFLNSSRTAVMLTLQNSVHSSNLKTYSDVPKQRNKTLFAFQTFQTFCYFCPPYNLEVVEWIESKLGPGTDEDRSV